MKIEQQNPLSVQDSIDQINNVLQTKQFHIQPIVGENFGNLEQQQLKDILYGFKSNFNSNFSEQDPRITDPKVDLSPLAKGNRYPIGSILYHENNPVGICFGVVAEKKYLDVEMEIPHSVKEYSRKEGIRVLRYWLDNVSKQNQALVVQKIGILPPYRRKLLPFLLKPLFLHAQQQGCNVGLSCTFINTAAFKWTLGGYWTPLYFFREKNLALMQGNISRSIQCTEEMMEGFNKISSMKKFISTAEAYLCQDRKSRLTCSHDKSRGSMLKKKME